MTPAESEEIGNKGELSSMVSLTPQSFILNRGVLFETAEFYLKPRSLYDTVDLYMTP